MDTSNAEGRTSWIPVSETARLLKVSPQRVYQLIAAGAIVARQCDRTWLVSYRSVEARIELLRSEAAGIDADR